MMNKSIRKLGLVALLGMAVFKPSQPLAAQDIQRSAIQQIESLNAEKEARTMVQKKLDSQLWYALKMARGQNITPLVKTLQVSLEKNASGKVHIELYANVSKTLLADLEKLGMEIETSLEKYNSISGYAPVLAMESIAALADVQLVKQLHSPVNSSQLSENRLSEWPAKSGKARAAGKALRNALIPGISRTSSISAGAVTTQADVTHRAADARSAFNLTGAGIKIGVISDSYNAKAGASADVLAGELPGTGNTAGYTTPVTVRSDFFGTTATDEGRAMMQLVHDIAPGAQLYFATGKGTESTYASAIIDLKNQGCSIIVDDLLYLAEPVFQDGIVARAVNEVTAAGVLYFSAAGNNGNKTNNKSGTWEGDFSDGGVSTTPAISGGTLHNFGATKYNALLTQPVVTGLPVYLKWSDGLGKSSNDYDMYALDPTGATVTASSTNVQDGNDDPSEFILQPVINSRIVIFKKTSAAARALHLQTVQSLLSISTTGAIFGHAGAEKAISVGATPATAAFPNIFSSVNKVENFSSDGLRKIFYNPDSTAITPGNFLFSSGGGRTVNKPDITAADGCSTSVSGFTSFFGTSAAAPQAAAIAALVKQSAPTLSADNIKSALRASAIDIEASGFDRDAGAGIIMAYEAVVAARKPAIKSVSPNIGFGNSGETITIKGSSFNTTAAKNIVQFGSVKASVLTALDSILTVALPVGVSAYAPVRVLNSDNGLSGVSPASFLSTFSGKNSFGTSDMAAKVDFTTGANPNCVATGDLDGDGKLDMVVANSDPLSTKISVYRNTSASGSITSASFSSKVDFTTGTRPESLVIGDLDGDGKPEIVVANGGSTSISVLKNTSVSGSITSASFAPKVDFSTFNQCNSVAIGDIDNDGKPDLAVTQIFNNAVSVFRNTSALGVINTGSFASRVDFATGVFPYSVTIGDLDGDKKSEIVVANFSGASISVLRNTATMGIINTSSMATKVDFPAGTNPISLAIGDLDGDGKPDLAVSNYGNANASVYRNISTTGAITTASFAARVSFTTGTNPYSIAIGDLNGDSKPDLAVANYNSASVSVLRNTAVSGSLTTASFAAKVDFSTGTNPISLAIADLDGDGKQDLATTNYNGPATVSVLRNNQAIAPSVLSFSPASAKAGDLVTLTGNNFNQTAASNMVFFGATRGTVMDATFNSLTVKAPFGATFNAVTVLNSASGLSGSSTKSFLPTFSGKGSLNVNDILPKVDFTAGTNPLNVAIGDLDGDGKSDLVVLNADINTLSVFRNVSASGSISSSSFQAKVDFATGSGPISVALGDLDRDGKLDLAVTNLFSGTISVYRNISTIGSITGSSFAAKVDFSTGSFPVSVSIGDLDRDGMPDLVVANNSSASVSILRNTSVTGSITSSSFAAKFDIGTGYPDPSTVALGDLDGDGKLDIAVTRGTSTSSIKSVMVIRNTSGYGPITSGSFAPGVDFALTSEPRDVAIGDLDLDGKPDLVVASVVSSISILRNTSAAGSITSTSFAAQVNLASAVVGNKVKIGDLDGDGKPDLVATNVNSTISVFRNISAPGAITVSSFASKVDFVTGSNPSGLAIGDLDGDGKSDLTVTNNSVNTISVFRNNPSLIITFNANGGIGTMVAQTISNNASANLTTNSFTRTGYSFGGWNTAANGSGTSYANGGSYTMGEVNVTLFAIWVQAPTITSFTPSSGCPGTLVTIAGTNLVPTALTIGGKAAIVVSSTGTSLRALVMPGAITGSVTLTNAAGTATGSGNFTATATPYPSAQQGNKLVGTGAVGVPGQGRSVSLSADGNTALVGGWEDNGGTGAAWVFTRSGGVWAQQGTKLLGSGAVGSSYQGTAVALSADGNTAIVGGYYDDSGTGAAWVFVRSGSTWTQQGAKLVGTGAVGAAYQGWSVSLSADGNTAISGGFLDNSDIGATWVFVRSGGVWIQQGNKLVGTGSIGTSGQGESVSLSADGKTAIIGGSRDDNFSGAVWVFTRTGSTWTQQGDKLVGTDAIGAAEQGAAVAMSADGNTAIVGGYYDDLGIGAAWVFTRSGSTWTQQGNKLVDNNAIDARIAKSVSLSADGNTAILGGYNDNTGVGATWVFTRNGLAWTQQGSKLVGTGAVGTAIQGWALSLSSDGNTALVAGNNDNNNSGAAWVYAVSNTVTYIGNGNTGGTVPAVTTGANATSVSLATNSGLLVKSGFIFAGWNSLANGTGTRYPAGSSFVLAGNVTLYAQWMLPPSFISFTPKSGCTGSLITINGTGFLGVTGLSIGGTAVQSFTVISDNQITATAGATRGIIQVNNPVGSASSSIGFTQIPSVSAVSSASCGGSALSVSTLGGAGNALNFGTSSMVVNTAFDISPSVFPVLTASAWVNRTGPISTYSAIISNDNGGFDRALMVVEDGTYHIFAGRDIATGISSTLNSWEFISVTWSASAVTLFKNGVQVFSTSGETISSSIIGISIGMSPNANWPFRGIIDQVSVWSTSRTAAQLQTEMNTNLTGLEAGIQLYYKFDEGSGTTTADLSGKGRTGTLLLSPTWTTSSAPTGYTNYLWSPGGETTRTISVNPLITTNYTVQVSNGPGCSLTSAAATVNIAQISGGLASICVGSQTTWTGNGTAVSWTSSNPAVATVSAAGLVQGITPGTATVTYTSSPNCTATRQVTVTAPPAAPAITGTLSFCPGSSTTLTASAGFSSYLWSNGATTQTISVNTAGNFTVSATNAGGCAATSASVTTSLLAAPATPVISGGSVPFCSFNPTTLTASAGYSSYLWSNGATTQSISVNTSGTFTVAVKNAANNCSTTSASVTTTALAVPTKPVISGNLSICPGASTTLDAGAGYSAYFWSNGATTRTITVTTAGTYYVNVNHSINSCEQVSDFVNTSIATSPATPVISGSLSICPGSSTTLNAGAGYSSYLWSNGATTQSISVTTAGTYSVTVKNPAGCSANSASVTTSLLAAPATPVITGTLSFCSGSSTTLTASAGYSSYLWSNGATTQSISVTTAGSYSVTAKNAAGCSATSASVTTSLLAAPATPVISGTLSFCSGSSTTITASAGYSSYLWSNGATTQSISVSTAGSYSVTVKNAANNCTASATVTTSLSTAPATPVISGTLSFCSGASTTLTASAGYSSYLWSNGATTQSISVTTAGTYSVTVKNAANNCTASATVTTSLSTAPATPVISGTLSFCSGASTTLTASAGYSSYLWSNGATTQSISVSTAGSYSVTAKNAAGCSATSDSVLTSLLPSLPATGALSGPAQVCKSATGIVYTVPAVSGATSYAWTLPTGATGTSTTNSITLAFSSTFAGGSLCVTPSGSCGAGTQRCLTLSTITAAPAQPVSITGTAAGVCSTATQTYSVAAVSGADSYTWTAPANSSIVSGQGNSSIVLQFVAGFTTGTLSVVSKNCFGSSAARTLALSNVTAVPASITGPVSAVCAGSTQTYSTAAVSGATIYTWAVPTGAIINSGQGTATISVTFQTTFTSGAVTVKSGTACYTTGTVRSVTVYAAPATPASITGAAVGVCAGTTQTYTCPVSTTGATTYNWTAPTGATINSGQGSTSISVTLPAGFATGNVSVASSNSCGTSTVRTLAIRSTTAQPGVITGTASNLCAGGSFTYSIVAVTGASTYSWTAPPGCTITANTGTSITMTVPSGFTTGTLSVTANNACGASVARTLSLTGLPPTPASITGPTSVCASATGLVYSTPVVAGVTTYTWTVPTGAVITAGAATSSITVTWGTLAGSVTVKAGNACGTNATARSLAVARTAGCRGAVDGENQKPEAMSLYPNPASQMATLSFGSATASGYSLRVTNTLGQVVYSSEGNASAGINTIELNLEKLSSGLYIVQLVQDGQRQQLNMIKR